MLEKKLSKNCSSSSTKKVIFSSFFQIFKIFGCSNDKITYKKAHTTTQNTKMEGIKATMKSLISEKESATTKANEMENEKNQLEEQCEELSVTIDQREKEINRAEEQLDDTLTAIKSAMDKLEEAEDVYKTMTKKYKQSKEFG